MTKLEIGTFVLNERKKQSLSQKKLAEKVGIKRYQQILEIEKGQFDFGVDILIRVINALGYKLAFIEPSKEQPIIVSSDTPTGMFNFKDAKSATEDDNPDFKTSKKNQTRNKPTAIFKSKR